MRIAALILLAVVANTATADYYECTSKTAHRWSGEPCVAGEKQITYDSKTKQRKRDASSRPSIGMTAEQVLALPDPWGKLMDVNTTATVRGTREQWVFRVGMHERGYPYLENGIVTGIQAPDYMR